VSALTTSSYCDVMNHVAERVVAATESMDELWDDPHNSERWRNCDFIALQVRKLCELFVLGSRTAHFEDGHHGIDLK